MMKRGPQVREKKIPSIHGLLGSVKTIFTKITSPINGRKLSLADCLMSALAMFSLKSPQAVAYNPAYREKVVKFLF